MRAETNKIAVLVCSNVIGGHEFQVKKLAEDLSTLADVTIFINKAEHLGFFLNAGYESRVLQDRLLTQGWLGKQCIAGLGERFFLSKELRSYDQVIVCAGAVEASAMIGVALFGIKPASLYLPSFYDRVPLWGALFGFAYNTLLECVLKLFRQLIVINRIQGKILRQRSGRPVVVLPNIIREARSCPDSEEPKLVFVGRIDKQKRVTELIDWLDFEGNPFKKLLIIGSGPEMSSAVARASEVKSLVVEFAGWQSAEEQDRRISNTDVLLLNSKVEGEPLVLREAHARGMRCLVRNIPGVRGITSRSERFDSREELQKKLESSYSSKANVNLKGRIKLEWANRQRCKAIRQIIGVSG